MDRAAARDPYDLYPLAHAGHITPAAGELFARVGPIRGPGTEWAFHKPPTTVEWRVQLAEQVRLTVAPEEALAAVRAAWAAVAARSS